MKLYPAILSKNIKNFQEKTSLVKNFSTIHVDIMDNKFVPNKTITLKQLKKIKQRLNYSFHLMIYNPEKQIELLKNFKTKEVFIHCKAVKNIEKAIKEFKKNKILVGLAFNPETRIENHLSDLKKTNHFLIMTVQPGFSGQKFLEKNLKKIKLIRKHNKKARITIDGGVNFNTFKKIKKYNPDVIVAASAIFEGNVKENIKKWCMIL